MIITVKCLGIGQQILAYKNRFLVEIKNPKPETSDRL